MVRNIAGSGRQLRRAQGLGQDAGSDLLTGGVGRAAEGSKPREIPVRGMEGQRLKQRSPRGLGTRGEETREDPRDIRVMHDRLLAATLAEEDAIGLSPHYSPEIAISHGDLPSEISGTQVASRR